ncbi:hypothetical protein GALMADRAFT_242107 [Galerina marginata CBS 339.88]|uniref:Uncharacterized protein n=1 Tax=Galerina marginata (strain CBS 339.88) TaxID=685588 RepID=A0A067T9V8_GALM3|nr:hypothetical protein GALMADRAFT_242107 [Galerina marginata CBS 339.88]
MAQYANTVAADRSFPLTPVYYQGTGTSSTTGGSAMPMTVSHTQPPHHQSVSTWPQYFAESPLLPPPSTFTSYIPEAGSSTSLSSYGSSWQNNVQPSTFATGSGVAPSFQRPIDAHPVHTEYQPSTQSLTISDYPTSSQRTILPPSPPQVTTTFPPSYGFRTRRIGSPSSHASTSDYGTGTKGWESPCLNAAEERYTPSHMGVVDGDESVEQITEDGSRQPSVSASTTTSSSSHPSVKLEPDDPDGCFIMELSAFPAAAQQAGGSNSSNRAAYRSSLLSQSLAPPTEVPLRATGASKEMRRMMGVFRLNPFAMHSLSNLEENSDTRESPNGTEGGTEASWCGEGQPLQEEPVMFEFQLRIDGLTIGGDNETRDDAARSDGGAGSTTEPTQGLRAEEEAQLRSFSPSFELHPDDVDGDTYPRQESYLGSDTRTQGQDRELDHDREQDQDHDHDRHSDGWGETDYGSRSEVDTNSTTTTRSVHTPLNASPQSMQQPLHDGNEPHPDQTFTPSPSSVWDAVNEQFQTVEETHFRSTASATLPAMAKVGMIYGHGGIKVSRLDILAPDLPPIQPLATFSIRQPHCRLRICVQEEGRGANTTIIPVHIPQETPVTTLMYMHHRRR